MALERGDGGSGGGGGASGSGSVAAAPIPRLLVQSEEECSESSTPVASPLRLRVSPSSANGAHAAAAIAASAAAASTAAIAAAAPHPLRSSRDPSSSPLHDAALDSEGKLEARQQHLQPPSAHPHPHPHLHPTQELWATEVVKLHPDIEPPSVHLRPRLSLSQAGRGSPPAVSAAAVAAESASLKRPSASLSAPSARAGPLPSPAAVPHSRLPSILAWTVLLLCAALFGLYLYAFLDELDHWDENGCDGSAHVHATPGSSYTQQGSANDSAVDTSRPAGDGVIFLSSSSSSSSSSTGAAVSHLVLRSDLAKFVVFALAVGRSSHWVTALGLFIDAITLGQFIWGLYLYVSASICSFFFLKLTLVYSLVQLVLLTLLVNACAARERQRRQRRRAKYGPFAGGAAAFDDAAGDEDGEEHDLRLQLQPHHRHAIAHQQQHHHHNQNHSADDLSDAEHDLATTQSAPPSSADQQDGERVAAATAGGAAKGTGGLFARVARPDLGPGSTGFAPGHSAAGARGSGALRQSRFRQDEQGSLLQAPRSHSPNPNPGGSPPSQRRPRASGRLVPAATEMHMLPTLQPFSHPAFPADAPVPLFVVQRHNHLAVRPATTAATTAVAATTIPAPTAARSAAAPLPNLAAPASASPPLNGTGGPSGSSFAAGHGSNGGAAGVGAAVAYSSVGDADAVLELNVDAISSASSAASDIEDDTDQIRYQSM